MADTPPTATRPASQPFAPGVRIDWVERAVRVDATIVLREGALEFLACFPGKEHESIARFDAAAEHIYQAIGVLGLTPRHAVAPSGAPPRGDLVDIAFEWRDGEAIRRADASAWLRDVEYGRSPFARPWEFIGSSIMADRSLVAGRSGEGIALVSFDDTLIGPTRLRSNRTAELWVAAATDAIPPAGSHVVVVLRPARARPHAVEVDFRGAVWLNGTAVSPEDLADIALAARQLDPEFRLRLAGASATLAAERELLLAVLRERGVPEDVLSARE